MTFAALESACKDMQCVFCPDGNSKEPPPDVIRHDDGDRVRITGLEPLNAPHFFDVLDDALRRSPAAPVEVETTGLPLLDPALRARVLGYRNLSLLIPLYGMDAAANEAVTRNPAYFAAIEALLASEAAPRVRFQTLAVRANIDRFPTFLTWFRARRLTFGSLRVLCMRGSPRERALYRENVVPFPLLVQNYVGRLRAEPRQHFDSCFAALPLCVLHDAGLLGRAPQWSVVGDQIALDRANLGCPHRECAAYDDCPRVPDVYLDAHGPEGLTPFRERPAALPPPAPRRSLPVLRDER